MMKKNPTICGKLSTGRKLLEFFDFSSFAILYILEIEKNLMPPVVILTIYSRGFSSWTSLAGLPV